MSRKKKVTITIAVCLTLYSLVGFVVIPLILESILPKKLSEALNRPVTIENIRFNPFALTAAVEGLDIKAKNATEPFVSFDELFVNIQTMSLFKLGLVVKEVRLQKPDIRLARISDAEFNFSDLIPEKKPEQKQESKPEGQKADKKPFQFSISNIAVIDGNISFWDEPVQKKHTISPVNFNLPNISNFEKDIDTYSKPLLTGNLNHAGVSIDVDTKPFHGTLETIANLSLSGLEIPYYFAYLPDNMVGFEITNGSLSIDTQVSFRQNNDQSEVTVEGTIGLVDLELLEKNGSKLFALPGLQIDIAPSRPMEQQLTLASVRIQSPELSVFRNPDGIINLTTLGPKPTEKSDVSKEAPREKPTEKPEDISTEFALTEPTPDETAPETPFILAIDSFLLDAGTILFSDSAATPSAAKDPDAGPVEMSIDNLVIKLTEFSNEPGKIAKYDIHAKINKDADIRANGQLGLTPLSVESDFSLADLKLAWGQPYLPETIQLVIADGKFVTSGHAAVQTTPEGKMATTITGKAAINEFSSIDPAQKETFISWNTFSLDGIDISINPLKINTDKILLKDFKNQFIVFNDGTSNLNKIFIKSKPKTDAVQEPSEAETSEPQNKKQDQKQDKKPVIPIQIGEVLLDNFDFKFFDKNIEPHFSTRLNLSELRITGLTSEDFKAASLKAEGKIDEYAPIKIEGSINPLKEDLFLDVTYSLSNMELSPLSPYTGKFIGRMIEKGKLSTNVAYKIDKKEIMAQNQVLLDQFTLGQNVDSPDALNLPVGLAIALLKDRNGQINVDLPVSGRTDDPDFGFGKPILNALQNLLVKAATSPFDLVSSLAGGGEELRYIEFEPAMSAISDNGIAKLTAIKKLMYERPALKMEISGYVDTEADRVAMADLIVIRKIKQQKLKKDSPMNNASIDAIVLSLEEHQKFTRQEYTEAVLSDPEKKKTAKSLKDPTLTLGEMESLIRQEITVTDAEMRLLALERARQVKAYLLADDSVTANRLFLVEPKTLSSKTKGDFKPSRVELNVR
ncbi:MAG: DUF748 domain-containing protein [Desulfobacteraceae bacterium]|jgi:uncharacterized protein involved in outer membrane biogenesis|nr:DUF748 domain-containing protein [Desulfobacteraceae bacterium]